MGNMRVLSRQGILSIAQLYADQLSGCRKVAVGCAIVKGNRIISLGANKAVMHNCKALGCLRVIKYGEDSKVHRNPEDCSSIHSEIDALANLRESAEGATAYVTRYPCEGCAKALVSAGIKTVVYGGSTRISTMTEEMFDDNDIRCIWLPEWRTDLSDR